MRARKKAVLVNFKNHIDDQMIADLKDNGAVSPCHRTCDSDVQVSNTPK